MSQADVDAACPTCTALGDFLEIENAQDPADWDTSQSFPPEVRSLQIPNEELAPYFGFGSERLLKCPDCGTYYWYRQWAPGGSQDVLHTYIHESVRRLTYLGAHVALHDALDQAHRRALEYGGVFATEYESVRAGVDAERALLRAHYAQIIVEASDQIEAKYSRSQEVAETLALYSPQRDHSQQIEEEREVDRGRATYDAGVIAEYLAYAPARDLAGGLLQRLIHLLDDDVPRVRQIIRDALLGLLGEKTDPGRVSRLARKMVQAAEPLSPRYAELEDLVAACYNALRPPAPTSRALGL